VRKQLTIWNANLEAIDALMQLGAAFLPSKQHWWRSVWLPVNGKGSKPSLFESIPEAVPTSLLRTWFRNSRQVC